MAYTFQTLKAEVVARGFDYLPDARVARFVNDANHRINDLETWQYLQASASGAAPLTVSDLGRVWSVYELAGKRPLTYLDERDLRDAFTDLTTTGSPEWFYLTGGTVVNVFPVTSVSITVRYLKVQTDMSANGDVPLMPDRFRPAIVAYACAAAYRDVSNSEQAAVCEQEGDMVVRRMLEWNVLLPGMGGEQRVTQGGDW